MPVATGRLAVRRGSGLGESPAEFSRGVGDLKYEEPEVRDYGDLLDVTRAAGTIGGEDGAGKVIQAGVDPIVEVTVGIFP